MFVLFTAPAGLFRKQIGWSMPSTLYLGSSSMIADMKIVALPKARSTLNTFALLVTGQMLMSAVSMRALFHTFRFQKLAPSPAPTPGFPCTPFDISPGALRKDAQKFWGPLPAVTPAIAWAVAVGSLRRPLFGSP